MRHQIRTLSTDARFAPERPLGIFGGSVSGSSAIAARTILVVDDDADGAECIALVLRTLGHDADFVSDPRRALEAVREKKPHAVFVDIGMPHIDGYELARILKSENLDICIVAISGRDSAQDRRRGREAGFDAHVAKPADAAMLQSILETIFAPRWRR